MLVRVQFEFSGIQFNIKCSRFSPPLCAHVRTSTVPPAPPQGSSAVSPLPSPSFPLPPCPGVLRTPPAPPRGSSVCLSSPTTLPARWQPSPQIGPQLSPATGEGRGGQGGHPNHYPLPLPPPPLPPLPLTPPPLTPPFAAHLPSLSTSSIPPPSLSTYPSLPRSFINVRFVSVAANFQLVNLSSKIDATICR